ncbi:hypothetical protein ACFFGV_00960 [Pontibacillus salicampi]|uniref:DUF86 domain-containing protein n=1 Tax=Pontibacillus salicampi TaxID=1449801 RepID=A0ABV6LIE1_9BACI
MGEIIDFEIRRARRELKRYTDQKGIAYEIYLSVVRYVNAHLERPFDKPVEQLNTETPIEFIYGGNEERLMETFVELSQYWNLEDAVYDRIHAHHDNIFSVFETIGDLCIYIEKRVNNIRGNNR